MDKARTFLKAASGSNLGDVNSFDTKCYRRRLCHNPTVCKSWKDKACPAAEMKQFAEDEALFSAWTKEHRARAAGKTNEELDISASTAGSALDKDFSDNTALRTAAARPWTLTPTSAAMTHSPTVDQSCFADPESFDCSCFEKLKRQCRKEDFRKHLEASSVEECYEFFVCTHSQTCGTYKTNQCTSQLAKLKDLKKRGITVETC